MPNVGLRQAFELETRNKYTKVECELRMTVNGREVPNMAVLGAAVEDAIELIQSRITESYKVVPPRVNEPETAAVNATTAQQPVPTPAPVVPVPQENEVLVELKPWQIGG